MPADVADIHARLDAWRAQGSDRLDPHRFALMDALARRAMQHDGLVRQHLDARLRQLADAHAALLASPVEARPNDGGTETSVFQPLLEQLANAPRLDARLQPASMPQAGESGEARPATESSALPLLDEFQQLWSRIRIDSLLRQCLDGLPEDAGPLHSSVLTYRAMALMREVCPEYLQHFVAYADVLTWLEQLAGNAETCAPAMARKPARTGSPRRRKPAAPQE